VVASSITGKLNLGSMHVVAKSSKRQNLYSFFGFPPFRVHSKNAIFATMEKRERNKIPMAKMH
jgi:hypothetical protein